MNWLCLQSLTYLCLGRGGCELESNISTLSGVASSWILITSHFAVIASDGAGISSCSGMGIGCYLGRLPLCCSSFRGFTHDNSNLRCWQLEIWSFSKQMGKGEMEGWGAQDLIIVSDSCGFFLELQATGWQGRGFIWSKSLSEKFQIFCLALVVTVQTGRKILATLKLKDFLHFL